MSNTSEAKIVFQMCKANHSHLIREVTLHAFSDVDTTNLSDNEKNVAMNDYNIICSKHTRHLKDENGTMVEVKPFCQYVGNNLVPPFPPIVSKPSVGTGCIIFGISTPNFPTIEAEYRMQGAEAFTMFKSLTSMDSVQAVPFALCGEYCFRIRGVVGGQKSPWSKESAFVLL
jgi:hypothetical protein